MGEHIVRRGQPTNLQQPTTRRLTAEIPAQQLFELIGDPARDDLETELERVDVLPVFLPDATPIHVWSTSAQLLTRRDGPRSAVTFAMRSRPAPAVPQAPVGERDDISTIAMPRRERAASTHPARFARVMSQVAPPASVACVTPAVPATCAAPTGPRSSAKPRPNMMMQRLRLVDVIPFTTVTRRWLQLRVRTTLLLLPFVLALLAGGSLGFWLVRFLR